MTTETPQNHKQCSKCKDIKPTTEFNKTTDRPSGLKSYCKSCKLLAQKKWKTLNKDKVAAIAKKYNVAHRDEINIAKKQWEFNNKDKVRLTKEAYKPLRNERHKCRYKTDINFKLKAVLRARLCTAINNDKGGSAVKDLGCTIEELKKHLESLFKPGMTWDNWTPDGWHIDHVIPLSKFDLTNPEEVKKACHYSNLQPLWAKDNLQKSDKLNDDRQPPK